MMHMTQPGMGHAAGILFALHVISTLAVLLGAIFLLRLALLKLTPKQLRNWGAGLLIVGLLVSAATVCLMSRGGMHGNAMFIKRVGMDGGEKVLFMNGEKEGGHMGMMMEGMMMELDGKTGDDFDKAFIDGMIVHHQGAIDMAKAAQTSAKHAEIKTLAGEIIDAQQEEIDAMMQWQKSWGYTE